MVQIHKWNQSLADTSMLLIIVILALGPLSRVYRPAKRFLSWRKELGIWAAITAFLHTYIVLDLIARWNLIGLFIIGAGPGGSDPGSAFANVVGLIGLLYLILLALISSKRGTAILGSRGWGYLQGKAHVIYALAWLHTGYFLFYRQLGRLDNLLIPFGVSIAALGILSWIVFVITIRKDKTGIRGPSNDSTVSAEETGSA